LKIYHFIGHIPVVKDVVRDPKVSPPNHFRIVIKGVVNYLAFSFASAPQAHVIISDRVSVYQAVGGFIVNTPRAAYNVIVSNGNGITSGIEVYGSPTIACR
jgi:hypothetical protein